jgi:hypothetical protein
LAAVIFQACDKADRVINRETIEDDIKSIIGTVYDNDVDSLRFYVLSELLAFSKDLDFYVESQTKGAGGLDEDLMKYLVSEETFKANTDKFFDEVRSKRYTYNQLLNEINVVISIREKYYRELEPIYKEVDSLCSLFQRMVDDKERNARVMKDSLNMLVEIKLISIEETKIDYSNAIAVRIQFINRTSKPIEAMSFAATLTDKLGIEVATLNCKTNDRFVKSDIGLWTYNEYGDAREIYKKLQNVSASHVTMKSTVKRINLGGVLVGSDLEDLHMGDYLRYFTNLHYRTPAGKLFGYCGYMSRENPYDKSIDEIVERRDIEIANSDLPIFKLFEEIEVYDYGN